MSENDKTTSRLTQKESLIGKQHPDENNINTPREKPYPNQEMSEGADNEQLIINNSNGHPNPTESDNKPEWIDGRKKNEDFIEDSTKE